MASPQVRTIEYDRSQRVSSYEGMYGLVIGAFDRGPIGKRVFMTNSQQVDAVFGKPKVGSDIAYYILHSFLSKSKRCWVERVAEGALYGGVSIGAAFDMVMGLPDGIETIFSTVLEYGRCHPNTVEVYLDTIKIGYDNGAGVIIGDNIDVGSVNYETGAITCQFTHPLPKNSILYAKWGFNNIPLTSGAADTDDYQFDSRILNQNIAGSAGVYSDHLVPFPIVGPDGTVASANDSTVLIYDDSTLIAYTDETGNLVDTGTYLDSSSTNRVEFGNGVLSFNLDSAYVPSAPLVAEYRSYKSEAFIIYADNQGSWADDYSILIDQVDFANNTFTISVYETQRNGSIMKVASYVLSREHKVDGFNNQLYIEDRLNDKSNYIRVLDNVNLNETEAIPQDSLKHTTYSTNDIFTLSSGDDGFAPSVNSYINVLHTFNNPEDVKVDIIVDTLCDKNFQVEMLKLCDRDFGGRGDCYAVLSAPFDLLENNNYLNEIANYRKYELNVNSSFGGLYSSFVKIYDAYNGREVWIPESGFVAAAFSYTADQFSPWFPAAGWRRGTLPVLDTYRKFTIGERDFLYDNGINVLRYRPGKGIAIWGNKTLYDDNSALSRANVRWLLIVIENAIEDYLDEYEFELNDPITRALITSAVQGYLDSIKARRGLYDFDVVCDETNNTPQTIDNYEMNVDYYVQPVKDAEFIYGRAVITRTGVKFEDVRI